MKTKIYISIILLILYSCQASRSHKENQHVEYIQSAFELIKENIINEKGMNLDSLEQSLLSQVNAQTPKDSIHNYLKSTIRAIIKHSDLFPPIEFNTIINKPKEPTIKGKIIYENIAYLYVGSCDAIDSLNSKSYADTLQNALIYLYDQNPIGWIIDLRDNIGGNMYAMIAGLGPLFGSGNLGYHIGKEDSPWYFKKEGPQGNMDYIKISNSDFEFERKLPLVALVNKNTASAAEAIAISFNCYPRSILIGESTNGLTTGNEMFFLSDSTCLNLTTSVMADCKKNKYPNGIIPEIELNDPLEIFTTAMKWIRENNITINTK